MPTFLYPSAGHHSRTRRVTAAIDIPVIGAAPAQAAATRHEASTDAYGFA